MSKSAADLLFVEFLRQGRSADFEALCRAHPTQAERLRELKSAHDAAGAGRGAQPAATIPLPGSRSPNQDANVAESSADLLRRIVAQGSKSARYSPRGEIARGGMGAILKVWDEGLGRELAMKIVLGGDGQLANGLTPGGNERRIARFLEEARVTGQLDHPCVVPVHELGLDHNGQVYFTMRLVRGRDLGRIFELAFANQEGWSETRALNVMLRVCEAMAFAHSKGVIHRDLKPSNVMVGSFGEVYVMDWGLARVQGRADAHDIRLREDPEPVQVGTPRHSDRSDASDSPLMTMEGEIIGTPAYMPPEQARGRIDEVSARSDVYSIGAMLYHLLARQMPYEQPGETRSGFDVLRDLLHGAPTPLRELRGDLPAELEAICEKAMAREPADRYADTLEFAEDLRAFLEGRVVKAHATGAIVELRKWIQRNKPLATAAALAIVFLVGGLGASLYLKGVADENAKLAQTRETQALGSARRSDAMLDFLKGMLAKANPSVSMDRDVKVSTVIGQAVKELDAGKFSAQPEAEFGLRETLGETYKSLSLLEEAERQLRIADELRAKLALSDPLIKARLDIEIADLLRSRSKFAEAESRSKSALETLESINAGESELMARALYQISAARYNLGSTSEAIDYMQRSLAVWEKVDGPDGESTATARSQLAFDLSQAARLDEALELLAQALEVQQHGSEHARFESTQTLRNRASVYQVQRKSSLAEADLREALSVREALLGEESVGVAEVLSDLAAVLAQRGKQSEAEELVRRALEVRRKLLGINRDTALDLTTLALLVGARGELGEARELLQESLQMRMQVFGPESSAIGDSLRRLGTLELDAGNPDTAEPLFTQALANWNNALGLDHPDIAMIERELARIHRSRGQWKQERELLQRALAKQTAKYGETSSVACDTRERLVTAMIDLEDLTGAEQLLREMLPKYEAASSKDSLMVAYTGAQLGAVLVRQAEYDEAEPLLLAGWKAVGQNPRVWAVNKLLILDHLVALYAARGDESSAKTYREIAAELR